MNSFSIIANIPFLAFGIPSGPDLIIFLIIVLVLFGAKRLPEIARSLGQSVNEFKKAKQEFDDAVTKPTPNVSTKSATTEQTTPTAPLVSQPPESPLEPPQHS